MNILIIRNCPVVILSYIIKYAREADSNIYVLTHDHAMDSVSVIEGVKDVIPYHSKELFSYKYLDREQVKRLKSLNICKIYFKLGEKQKNGFENLLSLALKIKGKGVEIAGVSPSGKKVVFSKIRIISLFIGAYCKMIITFLLTIILILALPFLCSYSFLTRR